MAGVAHLRPAAFAPILCPTAIHSCSHCGREETCSCLLVAYEGEGRREEGGRREGEKRREEGGGEREKEGGRRKGERKEGRGKRVKEGEEGRVRKYGTPNDGQWCLQSHFSGETPTTILVCKFLGHTSCKLKQDVAT